MNEKKLIIKTCPRCGHKDVGKYCSECSYELDAVRENTYHEIYRSFSQIILDVFPFAKRFISTWWYCLFSPGNINVTKTYIDKDGFLNDIKFINILFFMALGSTLAKSALTFELPPQTGKQELIFFNLFSSYFIQSYVLWIVSFLLLAFIWVGRIWQKWMKINIDDQRQYDSIFIYEFGMIATIVIILFWLVDINDFSKISETLLTTIIALPIFAVLHFLYLLLAFGIKKKLPLKRLIIISLICTYLFPAVTFGAQLVTLPVAFLPILIILYPLYYLLRKLKKIVLKPNKI